MIQIRRATLRDLPVLVRHRRHMFEDLGQDEPPPSDTDDRVYRHWARARMRSGRLVGFIADRGVASGCVWVREHQPRPGIARQKVPYLLSMYTDPDFRGKGLASRIVRKAMEWARRRGYARMFLHASSMGRGVYKKLGWKRTWEMRVEFDR